MPYLVQELNTLYPGFIGYVLVGFPGCKILLYVMRTGTTENNYVQKRVCAETVCTMYRNTSSFSCSVKTWDNFIFAVLVNGKHLASILGGNATHCRIVRREW